MANLIYDSPRRRKGGLGLRLAFGGGWVSNSVLSGILDHNAGACPNDDGQPRMNSCARTALDLGNGRVLRRGKDKGGRRQKSST
jgi:hypothetical protein